MKKSSILSLFAIVSCLASVGSAFALIKEDATDATFSFKAASTKKYTLTYNLPRLEDKLYQSYASASIEVSAGTTVGEALTGHTSDIGSFKFQNWSTDTKFDDNVNATIINSDMTVYGKYSRDNILYFYNGSHNYYSYSPSSDVTINDNNHKFMIGTQTYGINAVVGTDYDIYTTSGIFKFALNSGAWSCQRKFTVDVSNVAYFWHDSNAVSKLQLMKSGESDVWTEISFEDNQYVAYIDYSYNSFAVHRYASDKSTWWNGTINAAFTEKDAGSAIYSKDHTTFYIQDSKSGNNQHYTWW